MKIILILIFWAILPLASFSQASVSLQDWVCDMDFIKNELPKRHINLFAKISGQEFNLSIDQLKNQLDTLNYFSNIIRLQELISKIGDNHTFIQNWLLLDKNKSKFPFISRWFADGIGIVRTTKAYESLIGMKVLSINKLPIDSVLKLLARLIPAENKASIKLNVTDFLNNPSILKFYQILKSDTMYLQLEDSLHLVRNVCLRPTNEEINAGFKSKSITQQNREKWFWFEYIDTSKTLFIQYNHCWSRELEFQFRNIENNQLPSFKTFSDSLLMIIKTKKPQKVVFDLRYNSGGASFQGTDLITKLSKIHSISKKNKLFVLVGRTTFSSAILNAYDFKHLTKATFIGEPTSGKPNHYGEVRGFETPGLKIGICYSTKYFKNVKEEVDSLIPDILVEPKISDYVSGRDLVYEYVLGIK